MFDFIQNPEFLDRFFIKAYNTKFDINPSNVGPSCHTQVIRQDGRTYMARLKDAYRELREC
jgi:hypothetical protein